MVNRLICAFQHFQHIAYNHIAYNIFTAASRFEGESFGRVQMLEEADSLEPDAQRPSQWQRPNHPLLLPIACPTHQFDRRWPPKDATPLEASCQPSRQPSALMPESEQRRLHHRSRLAIASLSVHPPVEPCTAVPRSQVCRCTSRHCSQLLNMMSTHRQQV